MRNYIKTLFFLVLISCNYTSSNRDMKVLPDSNLINDVISVVIKTDSLWRNCHINKNIRVLQLYKKIKTINSSIPSPPPPSIFSISYDELFKFFKSEKDLKTRYNDSVYIMRQINSSKTFSVSNTISATFTNDDESYYQFYQPIFSSDKKSVYIFYARECGALCGAFYEIVLRQIDNKWIKVYGDLCGKR